MENENIAGEPMVPYNQPLDFQQVWRMFQETDRMLTEKFKETDRMLSAKFSETDKRIRKLDQLFTSQWGKLVESLVEGDLVRLLNEKGIAVHRTMQRVDGNFEGQNFEYDLIAINGTEIVIVEVKTTLRPDDVTVFHEKLWKAKTYLPEYHDKIIYGAMAFITVEGSSHRMAEKQGLFVIRATGSSSSIINRDDFKPKAF
jgi:Holliday junction resolvase